MVAETNREMGGDLEGWQMQEGAGRDQDADE